MTCQEFSNLMPEDWRTGEAALHEAACAECAGLAARSHSLQAGLRELAATTDGRAPARTEARLLDAFRAQRRPAPAPVPRRAPAIWRWPAALAAALLLLAVIPAWQSRRAPVPPPPAAPRAAPAPQDALAAFAPPDPRTRVRQAPGKPRLARAHKPIPAETPDPRPPAASEGDFIPLPFAARVTAAESLDVVRVRFPRSSMIRFGLPVPAERAWEPVNADVVIGQDGLARAIRFVK